MSNDIVPFQQLERMATVVVKSNLFPSVKDPSQALMLLMVAQSEGIPPIQAMMEYDVIQGKISLKSAAMLARYQRAGGKVKWIESSDERVTGEFTHPAGGTLSVTWDTARINQAGLGGKEMHKKFPQQMKRARCISEGCRATCPGLTLLYVSEEVADMQEAEAAVSVEQAVQSFSQLPMPQEEVDDFLKDISQAPTQEALKDNFAAAWKRAKEMKDDLRMVTLKTAYDARRDELAFDAVDGGEKI